MGGEDPQEPRVPGVTVPAPRLTLGDKIAMAIEAWRLEHLDLTVAEALDACAEVQRVLLTFRKSHGEQLTISKKGNTPS